MKRSVTLTILAALFAQSLSTVALAAAPKGGCIVLLTTAEREVTVKASDGTEAKSFVPSTHFVPGTEVVWTTSAKNNCARSAEHIVIDQPVPEHMVFVADSAIGGGAQITLSTDGKEFRPANQLTARGADGGQRPARAEDVRFVRWTLSNPIAPNDQVSVRYRAVLK